MPAPGSVSSGSLVSSTGLSLDNGAYVYRERDLYETANGVFELGNVSTVTASGIGSVAKYQDAGSNLPGLGYAYVGVASAADGSQFPVFYAKYADRYFVQGVDATQYGSAYTVLNTSSDTNGVYYANELDYDTPGGSTQFAGYYKELFTYDYRTEVETQTITAATCYLEGTHIAAAEGHVPVERLQVGDAVLTAAGVLRRIRWIGRRSYAGRFLAANPAVQPIRFRAGSLGSGLPQRDLLVSPNHSMFLDGVLVQARHLVNGGTIVQERSLARVDYFHVELDSHDVLLAEGAPSESFVDDNSRGVFCNAAEWERLHPDQGHIPAVFCAPRVESGPVLEAIRRRLGKEAIGFNQAA